jgi:hypothetical protein
VVIVSIEDPVAFLSIEFRETTKLILIDLDTKPRTSG